MKKSVILLSGGLDSATCLAIAKAEGYAPYALSFDYGQRQRSELIAAQRVAQQLGAIEHKTVSLSIGELGGSALTDHTMVIPLDVPTADIPTTYVPARNTIFLSIALGWAEILGAYDIFIGVSAIDFSNYPDCRPEFINAFAKMANLATKMGLEEDNTLHIHTPLIALNKAETILTGLRHGVDYSLTVSCYQANQHGAACGRCHSCHFRQNGFKEAQVADPTLYQCA